MQKKNKIYFFSLLLAFCSLFYEYVYAQLLAACLGGTKSQFIIIISVFTSSLGIGSLLQGRLVKTLPVPKMFPLVEGLLIILGGFGPFFLVWLLKVQIEPAWLTMFKSFVAYFFVFLIGLLSGFEIPCLFSMIKNIQGKILAYDYMGMLLASMFFPFVFLPYLGTGASALFVANLNALAFIWLLSYRVSKKVTLLSALFVLLGFISVLYFRTNVNHLLSELYLGEA